jgi:hypothetical protein
VRHYESDIIILVALIIVMVMPTNAVGIATTVTVVGGNANAPPTINNVVTDFNWWEMGFVSGYWGTHPKAKIKHFTLIAHQLDFASPTRFSFPKVYVNSSMLIGFCGC